MAKFGSDSKGAYAIVQRGDTLSEICYEYFKDGTSTKYKAVAKLNGIPNPNAIQVGQKIYLTGTASKTSSKTSKPSNKAYINYFGLLASTSKNTLYAAWTNPKPASQTDTFEYEWEYTIPETGKGNIKDVTKGKWWTASKSSTKEYECTCDIPDNAELIRFRVKPIAKTREVKKTRRKTVKKTGLSAAASKLTGGSSTTTETEEYTVQEAYWTCDWTNFKGDGVYRPFNASTSLPPSAPSSAPTVKLDEKNKYKLTAQLDKVDADALEATSIQFQIVRNNTSNVITSDPIKINKNYNYVSYTYSKLTAGAEFKVRCRSVRGSLVSEWTDYSSSVTTPPAKPAGFTTIKAKSSSTDGKISVYLAWKAVPSAQSYDIEYATSESYFDGTDQTKTVTGITLTKYETFALDSGQKYFFRLRAKNAGGESDWSAISDGVALGEPPEAPTTWSSASTSMLWAPLSLYWVHNSKDGSSQTFAQLALELYAANGLDDAGNVKYDLKWSKTTEIENSTDVDEKDKTSSFDATTYLANEALNFYKDGVQLRWRVRTAGVTNTFGEWSIVRIVDIYHEPTLMLEVRDGTNTINSTFDTLGSFPIYISAMTSPPTQAPIGFYLTITANDAYQTVDDIGNDKNVNVGDQVYSKYFDQNTDLSDVMLSAGDVDLETGIGYTLTCVASMNSGLTAEASMPFTVSWEDVYYTPNAVIQYDSELITTQINPYCSEYTTVYHGVTYDPDLDKYVSTGSEVTVVEGVALEKLYTASGARVYSEYDNDENLAYYYMQDEQKIYTDETAITRREFVYTTSGEQVYSGSTELSIDEAGNVTGGDEFLYCEFEIETRVEGVLLSVYRREFDGSYTEIATDIDNTANTFVTDPHPALDYARYRIVATTQSTGAVSYYDVPAFVIGEKSIIIQWDEDWTSFDRLTDDPLSQPPWSGSLLKLPYNIDVSDNYGMDVSLVEYAGRKRPVSYYGTQLGESATWNTVIPKDDEETLYALRRLAIWTGDAYVREPSGSGYWANISVSFNQKHRDLTIPVTLNIKRVEGGA